MRYTLLFLALFALAFGRDGLEYGRYTTSYGEQDVSVVKIHEDLYIGKPIPDVKVITLQGERSLKSFINGHPTALLFAYYTCDTACPIAFEHLAKVSKDLSPNYRYVVLSFDEKDHLSTLKNFINKQFPDGKLPENWLVGLLSKEDINKLTQSVGYKFYFIPRDKIFIHPSVTIFLSPDGKVMRYLYGAFLREQDVKLAFVEAQKEKPSINNLVDLAVLACYRYDHSRSRYVIDPVLIFGGLGVLGLLATLSLVYIYNIKKKEVHQ
ncbi:MAG: SCO family protein [Aquificota bacterium]|nr:MAG: SCO family protein [Aquificota bacterium]